MKNKCVFYIVILGFGVLITSCKDNAVTYQNIIDETPSVSILPLKTGNIWFNKITHYPVLGSKKDTVYYDSTRVITDTIINNERWYKTSYGVLRNRSTGLWNNNSLMLSYPSNAGEIIKFEIWTITTVSIAESVSTAFGKFRCYHYRIELYDARSEAFLAPNIGVVKIDYYQRESGTSNWHQTMKSELQSANIN